MTVPGGVLYPTLAKAFDEGRAAARALADRPGGASAEAIATEAMVVMSKALDDAKCLHEPPPVQPAMTLPEAAELLCRLAHTPKLDPADPADVESVVTNRSTFEYAWAAVQRAGANPADADRAHAAHQLLAAHHGLR